ncbi:MAG: hypothetical protein JJE04_16175, partial [Acidobacteriia bacterium]|nr:hypothetical protein [Terriglobia bacterium]
IRHLNNEVYQYLQSVQAMVGAPITAVFLTGILWRGATARAAFTTLVFGGVIGAARFTMDILHNGFGYDLGAGNAIVEFSFLNFSVIVFLACVAMMVLLSQPSERHAPEKIAAVTLDWSKPFERRPGEVLYTLLVGGCVVGLWVWFA